MNGPSAEPFFLSGGATGCLLIHGFSGTPGELRGLGEHLAAQGYTVLAVRLPGHGGTAEDLAGVHWRAWLAAAEAGLDELRGQCARVVVVGFSLGGALGIVMARYRLFERLVLLATPLTLQGDWRLKLLSIAQYVTPWYYPLKDIDLSTNELMQQRMRAYDPTIDLSDPAVAQQLRSSIKISVRAINQLQQALGYARERVPFVRVPTLVMHGRDDDTAPLASAEELIQRLGSREKRLVWWEQTGHQLTEVGPHRLAIYEAVASFVAATAAPVGQLAGRVR